MKFGMALQVPLVLIALGIVGYYFYAKRNSNG